MMRTVRELIRLVVALVAGFVLLSVLAGTPDIGNIAASMRAIREGADSGRLPIEALPGVIAPALWLLWGYLALSTVLKALTSFLVGLTQGTLAGARAAGRAILFLDRLVERVSVPLVRNSTRMMVTAGMLVKLATSAPVAVAANPSPAVVVVVHDPRAAGHQTEEADQGSNHTDVRRGEGLYQVAERVWGDGERWPELWEANKGRIMPGGVRFNGSLREGWVLGVPGGKHAAQERESASPRWYTVQPRDAQLGLRGIAARYLGGEMRWREIYELNTDVIGENPDIIYIGQKLELPTPGEELRSDRTSEPSNQRQGRPEAKRPHAPRQGAEKAEEPATQGRREPEGAMGSLAAHQPPSPLSPRRRCSRARAPTPAAIDGRHARRGVPRPALTRVQRRRRGQAPSHPPPPSHHGG